MSQAEHDLVFSPDSPINQEETKGEWHYKLSIDENSEILDQDSKGFLYDDIYFVKALFKDFLKTDEIPEKMQIIKYDLNGDGSNDEILVNFDKNEFVRKSVEYFEILSLPFELSKEQLSRIEGLKMYFNFL